MFYSYPFVGKLNEMLHGVLPKRKQKFKSRNKARGVDDGPPLPPHPKKRKTTSKFLFVINRISFLSFGSIQMMMMGKLL